MTSILAENTPAFVAGPQTASPVKSGTATIDEAMLQYFRSRKIVVLSPHFDDACFSLGGFLARIGRGDLVNIFTQSNYLARRRGQIPPPDQQDVYAVRDAEDAAFAMRCGLVRHDIGCEEPSLRGRRPSELQHLEDDLGQIKWPLLAMLRKLADGQKPGERGVLLAPLGVGRHVNHLATSMLIFQHLHSLETKYDVFLYEDLPYASKLMERLAALRRARRRGRLGARYVFRTDWADKHALLQLYPSQLRSTPVAAKYWPRALTPFALHEAFWSVRSLKSVAEV